MVIKNLDLNLVCPMKKIPCLYKRGNGRCGKFSVRIKEIGREKYCLNSSRKRLIAPKSA